MGEFSKEYIDTFNPDGIPADFSIIEEFSKLEEGSFTPKICEGYGFIGITKLNGECKVIFKNVISDNGMDIIDFNDIDNYYLKVGF